jgi:CheY-like chemotaxis protein
MGHTVAQAEEGASGLALLEADYDAVDLIITDYAMPHMSGAQLIDKAREHSPAMPGIIITGYAEAQSISRRPEGVLVLTKPFTAEQLAEAIAFATTTQGKAAAV